MAERYRFDDPDGEHVITREEILATFFPYWSERMRAIGKADLIAEDACVKDWVDMHYAWPTTPDTHDEDRP